MAKHIKTISQAPDPDPEAPTKVYPEGLKTRRLNEDLQGDRVTMEGGKDTRRKHDGTTGHRHMSSGLRLAA